ncbi:DUF1003 domain-containing protein [Rhodococcus sp. AQ5-07]|uniref:DUF1003 domain-containing protein n=1 Tax=Rhodococcus sp. AQ5-07 TaxID=2054902 RepID=UPI001F059DCB|nr:DUF1003 domain-containing protein [Rhodococcus sp. AQ5-07]
MTNYESWKQESVASASCSPYGFGVVPRRACGRCGPQRYGSWPFVFVFVAIMGIWAGFNGNTGFDPYPFILLNLFLSMLAGMQGAILLISAKRADAISSEVAVHTLDNTNQLRQLIEANTALTETVAELSREIHKHVCTPEHTAR